MGRDTRSEIAVDDVVVLDHAATWRRSLVERCLRETVEVVRGLRDAGAHLVVFDIDSLLEPSHVFSETQSVLDRVDRALPTTVTRPIFLAWGGFSSLYQTGAFTPDGSVRPPRIVPPRGLFAGFMGTGEGGVRFLGADGRIYGESPPVDLALEWVRSLPA
jgi:hypothetical protein